MKLTVLTSLFKEIDMEEKNKLLEAREIINEVDHEMAALFCRRMEAARLVAEHKKEYGLPILDTAREEQVIRKNSEYLEDQPEEVKACYVNFLRETMAVSRHYQSRLMEGMKVAYSGTEGAFAYIAAGKIFPTAQKIGYGNFQAAYDSVVKGECDVAVLPMENSSAGEVGQVADLLFSGPLYVNDTFDLAVVHDLLILPGAKIEDVKTVVSHPQALSQCTPYIRAHGWTEREYVNTALAAEYVAKKGDKSLAAIASADAAEIYGLEVAAGRINETANNTTRFAVISSVRNKAPESRSTDMSFILMFTVKNEAGSLAKAIDIIGLHDFNMKSLRSRPMKELLWQYYFYVEAEGNIDSREGRDMIRELSAFCHQLKIIGSYSKR